VTTTCAEVQFLRISVGQQSLKLILWDTPGGPQFRNITRQYYRDTDCFIIVYDLEDARSQGSLKHWVADINETLGEEANEIPKVIVANKMDLNQGSRGSVSALENLDNVLVYVETSARTGYNMQKLFNEIGNAALKIANSKEII
jgi:small GTP-binding protein